MLEMCFVQENSAELVNISQVVENQTEKGSEINTDLMKDLEKTTSENDGEDISENIISDRHPRVFPSTKHSSSAIWKSQNLLYFFTFLFVAFI